jgi:hypothetical protein
MLQQLVSVTPHSMTQKQDGSQIPENFASSPVILLGLLKQKNHEPHHNARNPREEHHPPQPRALPGSPNSDLGNDHPACPR